MKSTITVMYYPETTAPLIANTDEWGEIQGFEELDEPAIIATGMPRGLLAVVMIDKCTTNFDYAEMTVLESFMITRPDATLGDTEQMLYTMGNALIRSHSNKSVH